MDYNPFSLKNKAVLVTGASSGIGQATAVACSRMGAIVVITGRNEERLQETYSMLEQSVTGHSIIVSDLSEDAEISRMVQSLPELDGIVSNAGIGMMSPVQFINRSDLDNVFSVNTFSHILLTKTLLRQKKLKKNSSLVYVSSISGYSNTAIANSVYSASKSALTAYVKSAALELASRGIRCNSVHPGRIETPLINNGKLSEEDVAHDMAKYPLKRYGKPEEVAWQIVYLLSDASSWVTGSQFVIDGGRSLK